MVCYDRAGLVGWLGEKVLEAEYVLVVVGSVVG